MKSVIHCELHSGTFFKANADAFKMKSLTDNLNSPLLSLFSCCLNLKKENTISKQTY